MLRSSIIFTSFTSNTTPDQYQPPSQILRDQVIRMSNQVLERPEMKIEKSEDIFRIAQLEMDWDIGSMVYAPEDSSRLAIGPDEKKSGHFFAPRGFR